MKKMMLLAMVLMMVIPSTFAQEVNGDKSIINGVKVYRVWGDHYERGYAQGYLMSDEVLVSFDEMMLDFFYTYFGRDYEQARQFYINNFTVEEKYTQEATGIVDGIQASGGSLYSGNLEREIDVIDILAFAATADLVAAPSGSGSSAGGNNFCSTLSSWGSATLGDHELNGGMVVLRNMDLPLSNDYSHHQYNLTIHFPEEEDELKWVHPSFVPGMISTPSAINEKGFAMFNNQGNQSQSSNLNDLYPTQLTMRNCMEMADGNGDLDYDLDDFLWQRDQHNYLYGAILTCVSPDSAIILEQNNSGYIQRSVSDNSVISGNNLVATNHFRELASPVVCPRYSHITDSLNASSGMSVERSWNLMRGAAGNATSIQTMQFSPSTRTLRYAHVQEDGGPSHLNEPAVFNLDYLLSQTPVATAVLATVVEDTLIASAQISNPLGNQIEVWAHVKNAENEVMDSTQMFDDGLHDGGGADDHLFGTTLELQLTEGEYTLELNVCNLDSGYVHSSQTTFLYSGYVGMQETHLPDKFSLDQNYPNPFNPSTTIAYKLPAPSDVSIIVYDILGQEMATLVSGNQSAGYKSIQWNSRDDQGQPVGAGMYLYVIQAGSFSETRKMLLLK